MRKQTEEGLGDAIRGAGALSFFIAHYLITNIGADVIQQTKHAFYHMRRIPHEFVDDCSQHDWPDYCYRRLEA